jgi:ribosomal-protein-alanine N-acetyltransferase
MILTTEHLLLREFEEDDWRPMLEYQSSANYLRYNPWWHRTEIDVRSFIHIFMDWSCEVPRKKFQFAVVLRDDHRMIGNCGLRMQTAHARVGEIGYEIDDRYWGNGYATEAARALLTFGFEQVHLHRIWAYCVAENTASGRVLTKIGMNYEGRQRESEWMKNRWWDTLHYAILDYEWQRQYHQ